MARGTGIVPLVSIAMVKPRACSASIKGSSTCSIGSPPVSTTKRGVRPLPRQTRRQEGQRVGVGEACRRHGRPCRRNRCRRSGTGYRAIGLAPRPQIAAGETAEHRRPPGLGAFALQRVVNLLDGIHGRNLAPRAARGTRGWSSLACAFCRYPPDATSATLETLGAEIASGANAAAVPPSGGAHRDRRGSRCAFPLG